MAVSEGRVYYGRDLEAMSSAVNYHKWIIEKFDNFFGEDIAEIGAGCGNFSGLIALRKINSLTLFEPSVNMYSLLEKRFHNSSRINTIKGYLQEVSSEYRNRFDTVVYNNVLEHIADDCAELENAYRVLKKNGCILVFVPAFSFLYSRFDKKLGHLRRYSKRSLVNLVEKMGFKTVKTDYFDSTGAILWYVFFVLAGLSLTTGNVSLYDRIVVPVIRRIENIISPPFGKNLLLVARKV